MIGAKALLALGLAAARWPSSWPSHVAERVSRSAVAVSLPGTRR
jgi:hypothetical protein